MDQDLQRLFANAMLGCAPFESCPHLAIAVSGGVDSRALALLTKQWADKHHARVTALVVDHQLQVESTSHAKATIEWLNRHAIDAVMLPVHVALNGNRQQSARDARYHAMTDWCRRHGVLHLLLGHHFNDQMETVLMRWLRGSGIDGLCAMQPIAYRHDVRLLRPLLDVPKATILHWMDAHAQVWIEDASNATPRYHRNRLRAVTPILEAEGMSPKRLRESLLLWRQTRDFLHGQAHEFLASHVVISEAGFARLALEAWRILPKEMGDRCLLAILRTVRGNKDAPRYEEVMRLAMRLRQPDFQGATLHGCQLMVHEKQKTLFIVREKEPASLQLETGTQTRWDDRFIVTAQAPSLWLRALGADGLKQLRASEFKLPKGYPATVLQRLPSLWHLDQCIAQPHIGYGQTLETLGITLRFSPLKALC
ncbi:MAG: tRNA lysidine(34) synthetase TilS [Rickettsiales bacterium]|nr:tRNA lysidine(34) synthetase TilS [Rickettsiales bacterium]